MPACPNRCRSNRAPLQSHVDTAWRERIVPELVRYIEVPAKSPAFDADWAQHGLLDRVLQGGRRLGGGADRCPA
jgi:hypothetical protein